MSEETKQPTAEETPETQTEAEQETAKAEQTAQEPAEKTGKSKKKKEKEKTYTLTQQQMEAAELAAKQLESVKDQFVRLTAEYDNYRKRTTKEKDALYQDAKADTISAFLAVYDNLERALNQPTEDAAYKKGVELTMNELVKIFTGLGVEIFGAVGDSFDPNLHNAVMHTEDEGLGENVIAQVFQKGFKVGDKIVRFAMVQVAN